MSNSSAQLPPRQLIGRENDPKNNAGRGIYIGRVLGIRFYLDYTWFLIAGLLVWGLSSQFHRTFPEIPPGVTVMMGLVTALLFFLSILLHELGHSIVSQRCGIPVPRITLLFIGGIAEISREPDDAKSELKIALGGPVVTAVLVAIYTGLYFGLDAMGMKPGAHIFYWLAVVNAILLIFNAVPGYPLDGGRVLRALIWQRTRNLRRATYVASRVGVGFSWFLMIVGVLELFFLGAPGGFVTLFIGLFLKGAADTGYLQTLYTEILDGVKVANIMTPDPVCIPATLPINLAVDDYFLADHHVAFPVCGDENEFRGLLRMENLKRVPRERWPYTTAADLVDDVAPSTQTIRDDAPASKAMQRLLRRDESRLGVLDADGRIVGIVTRHDILQFIRIRTELDERQ
jgi:Zn-dependent protease